MDDGRKRTSSRKLQGLMGGIMALGLVVIATSAGLGCSDPCTSKIEDRNDECGFTATYDGSCEVEDEACLATCLSFYTCDNTEEDLQECYDSCLAL